MIALQIPICTLRNTLVATVSTYNRNTQGKVTKKHSKLNPSENRFYFVKFIEDIIHKCHDNSYEWVDK